MRLKLCVKRTLSKSSMHFVRMKAMLWMVCLERCVMATVTMWKRGPNFLTNLSTGHLWLPKLDSIKRLQVKIIYNHSQYEDSRFKGRGSGVELNAPSYFVIPSCTGDIICSQSFCSSEFKPCVNHLIRVCVTLKITALISNICTHFCMVGGHGDMYIFCI